MRNNVEGNQQLRGDVHKGKIIALFLNNNRVSIQMCLS